MTAPPVVLAHPDLGSVTGIRPLPAVEQFLGIKYASIPGRFADPVLHAAKDIDATKLGPPAFQPPGGCSGELEYIHHPLPLPPIESQYSEFDCLNLNITRPARAAANLPVFVWVHGGGVLVGANCWPQFDLARFVELSVKKGKPVVGVAINYRLGALGLMTSSALQSAGYTGNYALKDVAAAFSWVSKHIAGFGGDPSNITAIGESAGSMLCSQLLQYKTPLYKRLIAFSGQPLLLAPEPIGFLDIFFEPALAALGIASDLSVEEKIKKLLEVPAQELTLKLSAVLPPNLAVTDTVKRHAVASYSDKAFDGLPGKQWVESIIFSDCKNDGSIMTRLAVPRKAGIAQAFASHLQKTLSPEDVELVLSKYGISPDSSDEQAFSNFEDLANDVFFYSPNILAARGYPAQTPVYVAHMNIPSPWAKSYPFGALHTLDVGLLYQNFRDDLDAATAAVAEDFAGEVLSYLHGGAPWPPFNGSTEVARVYAPSGLSLATTFEQAERRQAIWDVLARVDWEALCSAIKMFLFSP